MNKLNKEKITYVLMDNISYTLIDERSKNYLKELNIPCITSGIIERKSIGIFNFNQVIQDLVNGSNSGAIIDMTVDSKHYLISSLSGRPQIYIGDNMMDGHLWSWEFFSYS
jgi:hypothetical protein